MATEKDNNALGEIRTLLVTVTICILLGILAFTWNQRQEEKREFAEQVDEVKRNCKLTGKSIHEYGREFTNNIYICPDGTLVIL